MSRHVAARRTGRIRAVLCLALLAGLGATTSLAYWTDDVAISGSTFTAATLDLEVDNADPFAGATVLSMTDMVPGATSAQVLTIKNAGTAPLKYTLVGGLTGGGASAYNTAAALRLTVVLNGTKSGSGNTSTCTGGTVLYGPTALTSTTTTSILAKRPASPLATTATESLCFQVTFDSAAPSSLQGASVNAVFTATGTSDTS
ncbi:TasA family protein [Nocardioides stalactiti]|uniref:TasA family protein n=1 Tax=Nocardioides stalactiti TaxID=2755356 RepID=UPI00160374FB|nr:TasA family protein [Nocardioides stalactiti]